MKFAKINQNHSISYTKVPHETSPVTTSDVKNEKNRFTVKTDHIFSCLHLRIFSHLFQQSKIANYLNCTLNYVCFREWWTTAYV